MDEPVPMMGAMPGMDAAVMPPDDLRLICTNADTSVAPARERGPPP